MAKSGLLINTLLMAVHEGEFEKVSTIFQDYPALSPNLIDTKGVTIPQNTGASLLLIACRQNHLSIVRFLLTQHADVNLGNPICALTPLYIAAQENHLEVVRILLQHKAKISISTTDEGKMPLHVVCEYGCLDILTTLLQASQLHSNALVDDQDEIVNINQGTLPVPCATPLYYAATQGFSDLMVLLLACGANLDWPAPAADDGATSLFAAAHLGQVESAKILLGIGADVNVGRPSTRTSPLYLAAEGGHTAFVQLLLAENADPTLASDDGAGTRNE